MQLNQLRTQIDELLQSPDLRTQIKRAIECNDTSALASTQESSHHHYQQDILLTKLRNAGIVDRLLNALGGSSPRRISHPEITTQRLSEFTTNDRATLCIELLTAKALLCNLSDRKPSNEGSLSDSTLVFYLALGRHRFQSQRFPCSVDLDLNQVFQIDLDSFVSFKTAKPLTAEALLADKATNLPLQLTCVKLRKDGRRYLVSSNFIDWKKHVYLAAPTDINIENSAWTRKMLVELSSVGSEVQLTAGLLEIRVGVHLLPAASSAITQQKSVSILPPGNFVTAHFALEDSTREERSRSFAQYGRTWWQEYCLLQRGAFKGRMVKMYALDENGRAQFVTRFIHPLSDERCLGTVGRAVRFVACIPCSPWSTVGAAHQDIWCTGLSLISRNRGSVADHANLLCSILLGFGLAAYVAIGIRAEGSCSHANSGPPQDADKPPYYAWVIVFDDFRKEEVVIFDAVSGGRLWHISGVPWDWGNSKSTSASDSPIGPSDSIDCIYNHREFYANIQPTTSISSISLNLRDSKSWRPFAAEAMDLLFVDGSLALQRLLPPSIDTTAVSELLETQLKDTATKWRRNQLLLTARPGFDEVFMETATPWDDALAQLLLPMLFDFENEAQTQEVVLIPGRRDFKFVSAAVKNYVPSGYTFKAYPIQLLHHDASRALISALKSPVCQDILTCTGTDLRLAVRAQVFAYAETAVVSWCIFACVYKS
uniref:Centrosomal protein of n=2 Tax=Schistocephalus solidus TaxID=70667 RepID=A0A0V0J883_SCHSO